VSDVVAELEALRRAHVELLDKHASVISSHKKLEVEQASTLTSHKRIEVENGALRSQLKALLRRLFGRRSENLDGMQHELFVEAHTELDAETCAQDLAASEEDSAEEAEKKPKPRRKRTNEHIPRERIVYEVPESERGCVGCHETMQPFGEDVSEELDYVPAVLRVIQHVRMKYSCTSCHDGVVTADAPGRPIPRVVASARLLAHVATSKFGHHLPLYRLEQMFAAQGAEISRKRMCGWLGAAAELLEPVVAEMKRELLTEPLIQPDDTSLRYQDPSKPGQTGHGYLWA
jgi:transposase